MGICGPTHDERSWTFDLDPGGRRPGAAASRACRTRSCKRFPDYDRAASRVPADRRRPDRRGRHQRLPADDARLLDGVDRVPPRRRARARTRTQPPRRDRRGRRARRSTTSNNGVYQCGFAGSQKSFERRLRPRSGRRLDWLEERLARRQRYLVGDTITEADARASCHDARALRRRLLQPLHRRTGPCSRRCRRALGLRARPVATRGISATRSTSAPASSRTTTRCSADINRDRQWSAKGPRPVAAGAIPVATARSSGGRPLRRRHCVRQPPIPRRAGACRHLRDVDRGCSVASANGPSAPRAHPTCTLAEPGLAATRADAVAWSRP